MDQTTEAVATEQQPVQPDVQTTTTLTSETTTEQPKEIDFKSLIPEAYKEEKSLQNFSNMNDFVKSYLHSQKLVGADKIAVPNKYATDEDCKDVYKKLGTPDNADGYKYDLPEEHKIDEDTLKNFSAEAVKLGLLPHQANGIMKYYNDVINKGSDEQQAQMKIAQEESVKELRKEYGSTFERQIQSAKNLAHATLGKEFITDTLLQDGSRLGDNPTVIRAFVNLANKLSEDTMVKGDQVPYLTVPEINKQIATLQQEGSAYWDKRHPGHTAAVEEVAALIRKKNNEEDVK
jgi:aminoglycoside/choline kinase family phosphotransferase